MKPPRMHYSEAHGWVVDTVVALPPQAVAAACAYTMRLQRDRMKALPHGDRRDAIGRALARLNPDTVRQNILPRNPWERERIILEA